MKEVITRKHSPQLAPYFKSLNEEWLKRLFVVEPIDKKVLSNPQAIIEQGGQIIYAILANKNGEHVVGCVALKHQGDGIIELTKMAVTAECQAQGIGAKLMQEGIDTFVELKGKKLYLETHSSLKSAIKLYNRWGFIELPHPFKSEYQRSDFYMEYQKT